ncbi:MAG: hypothetical protein Q4A34_03685 [Candidatus Saccharibacteria bacterium]|nr:hypothetical protein [Candidatus Saccharibacteria bacterium]
MNTTLSGISDIVDIKTTRNGKIAQGSEGALSEWAVELIDKRQDVMRANGEKLGKDKESLRAIEYIAASQALKEALELSDEIARMRRAAKTDAEKAAVSIKEDELSDILSTSYDQAAESGDKKRRAAYDVAESYIINATVIGVEGAQAIEDAKSQAADAPHDLPEKSANDSEPLDGDQQEMTSYEQMLQEKYLGNDYDEGDRVVSVESQADTPAPTPAEQPGRMGRLKSRIKRVVGDLWVTLKERARSTKDSLVFAANAAMGSITAFRGVRPEDYSDPAEYRSAKIKATKQVLGATGILAFGAVAATEAYKWYSMASPVARAAGLASESLGDHDLPQGGMDDLSGYNSFGEVDDNLNLGMLHEHPGHAMGTDGVFDADRAVVPEVYGETELLPYDVDTDPYNADKLDVFNMSDGFSTENIETSMAEWKSDMVKSPEMMAMLLDQYDDVDPTILDDDLSNNAELFSGAQPQVVDIIDNMKDVHYMTVPAGTEYSSYYTFMDEDGNFQLGRSFGVSHDHDITFMVGTITDAFGNEKQIMVNTECGQICNFEPMIGSDEIPIIPQAPPEPPAPEAPPQTPPEVPTPPSDTPPATPNTPPETPLPPTDTPPEPESPGETPPPEPEPKNSAQNIDENPQLNQSVANGGEVHDSGEYLPPEQMVQPERDYLPPEKTPTPPLAPGAEPITAVEQEIREELPNEGGESSGRI